MVLGNAQRARLILSIYRTELGDFDEHFSAQMKALWDESARNIKVSESLKSSVEESKGMNIYFYNALRSHLETYLSEYTPGEPGTYEVINQSQLRYRRVLKNAKTLFESNDKVTGSDPVLEDLLLSSIELSWALNKKVPRYFIDYITNGGVWNVSILQEFSETIVSLLDNYEEETSTAPTEALLRELEFAKSLQTERAPLETSSVFGSRSKEEILEQLDSIEQEKKDLSEKTLQLLQELRDLG